MAFATQTKLAELLLHTVDQVRLVKNGKKVLGMKPKIVTWLSLNKINDHVKSQKKQGLSWNKTTKAFPINEAGERFLALRINVIDIISKEVVTQNNQ